MGLGKAGERSTAKQQDHWVAELRKFSVCQVADALGSSCFVETNIRPIDPRFRICGPALTVECPTADNLTVHHALHLAKPGDVLVVGASPKSDAALWGELMSISAQSKYLAGTIIDGAVRDPVEIQHLDYPVFCRDISPRRAAKETYGNINGPLYVGKIYVHPRDFILADANGIVCIESTQIQRVIGLASEIAEKETNVKSQIRLGRTTFEILELEQYIAIRPEKENKQY